MSRLVRIMHLVGELRTIVVATCCHSFKDPAILDSTRVMWPSRAIAQILFIRLTTWIFAIYVDPVVEFGEYVGLRAKINSSLTAMHGPAYSMRCSDICLRCSCPPCDVHPHV